MRVLIVTLTLVASVFTFAVTADAQSRKKRVRYTCTLISDQCVKNCAQQANRDFCKSYCGVTHADCMLSGRWNGTYRTFTRVIKR